MTKKPSKSIVVRYEYVIKKSVVGIFVICSETLEIKIISNITVTVSIIFFLAIP